MADSGAAWAGGASQANGFFGAYLKQCGYDAIIIQGAADKLTYLNITGNGIEIRDASFLAGKDTWETEDALKVEVGQNTSVVCIGPAGENLVRFAAIFCDKGHTASHNGLGAVMGSKRLKAIAVARGSKKLPMFDEATVRAKAREMLGQAKEAGGGRLFKWGTGGGFSGAHDGGWLPVRNLTTNIFPEHERLSGQYIRTHFERKPKTCFACGIAHCGYMKVTEGPYAGMEGEEPEYECLSGMGSQLGNTDPGAVLMLSDTADRLGININETGWLLGWITECYERGLLSKEDTCGLEMTWGNAEAQRQMMEKIACKEGCAAIFAEGTRRACEHFGGEAYNAGVFTLKGASPRGHDHRGRWTEMLDTCCGNNSTIEATSGGDPAEFFGVAPIVDRFSPEQIVNTQSAIAGRRPFEDSLGICRFCAPNPQTEIEALNAVTGWNLTLEDMQHTGKRFIQLLRSFNIRHGLTPNVELPSPRYCSTPVDGPVAGRGISEHFLKMRSDYYELMGWDRETGKPTPETLRKYGLEQQLRDLYSD